MRVLIFLFCLVALQSPLSVLASVEGVFELAPNHKVAYRYQAPQEGKPTLVLLNGLIWSLDYWSDYTSALERRGYGYLLTAYSTQPESLVTLETTPYFSETELSIWGIKQVGLETQDLTDEIMAVVNHLEIEEFSLVSLSYGSVVASQLAVQQKQRIKNLIFMAPAVVTSGRYNAYGASRHSYYSTLKAFGNPGADHFYDLEIYSTLAAMITPVQHPQEGINFIDFLSGVFQMARSSKWFDLKDYANSDLPKTHLFLASLEEAPLLEDQRAFWSLLEENPARGSLIMFEGAYHAIPASSPETAAHWTTQVIEGKLKNSELTVEIDKE